MLCNEYINCYSKVNRYIDIIRKHRNWYVPDFMYGSVSRCRIPLAISIKNIKLYSLENWKLRFLATYVHSYVVELI